MMDPHANSNKVNENMKEHGENIVKNANTTHEYLRHASYKRELYKLLL